MKTNILMDSNLDTLDGLELALFTVAPTATTNGTEVADANYARAIPTFGAKADGPVADSRQMQNNAAVVFGAVGLAAGVDVVAAGFMSGANVLYWGPIVASIPAGQVPRIPVGQLTVREA